MKEGRWMKMLRTSRTKVGVITSEQRSLASASDRRTSASSCRTVILRTQSGCQPRCPQQHKVSSAYIVSCK